MTAQQFIPILFDLNDPSIQSFEELIPCHITLEDCGKDGRCHICAKGRAGAGTVVSSFPDRELGRCYQLLLVVHHTHRVEDLISLESSA